MTDRRHVAGILVCVSVAIAVGSGIAARAAQSAPPAAAPVLTDEQMEVFLRTARITRTRPAGDGVTGSRRVTLTDGTLIHDAHVQTVNEDKAVYQVRGYTEMNFRDCYCYNIAGYRLARLLGIENVPVSVDRRIDGQPGAITWWVDDVAMDEEARRKKGVADPDAGRGDHYVFRQRVFDELIQNRDRNLGNLLYTKGWTMWMIDHTRAFRLGRELMKPAELIRIDRNLFANLKALTPAALTAAVGESLKKPEIEAVIARRDAIVALFEKRIADRSEAAVLYTWPR